MKRLLYLQPWGFSNLEQRERYLTGSLKSLYLPRVMFEVLYLVSSVPDIDYDYLDYNLELLENPQATIKQITEQKLKEKKYDIIFITFPAAALGNIIDEIIESIRKAGIQYRPVIVLGGSAMRLIKIDALRFWDIDYSYIGDGIEIPEIIQLIINKTNDDIPGLYKRVNEEIVKPTLPTGKNQLINYQPQNFFSLSSKIDFSHYLNRLHRLGIKPHALIELTRGCSHSCSFCSIAQEKAVRFRMIETVINEMVYLLDLGIKDFIFIDPTLGLHKSLTLKLLAELRKVRSRYQNVNITGYTRSDRITDSFVERLSQAGFNTICLGLETMTDSNLKKIQKKCGSIKNKEAVYRLNNYGIRSKLLIIHFPDRLSIETLELIVELNRDNVAHLVQSSFYRPLYQWGKTEKPDFRHWDQRIEWREIGLDSNKSIIEWLICNLMTKSTDVNALTGDKELLNQIRINLDDLLKNIEIQKEQIIIPLKTKKFIYQPSPLKDIIKSNLFFIMLKGLK